VGYVSLHILLNDLARDVLARVDAKGLFVHGEVTKLVGSQHVIGLETFVQPILSPDPANRTGGFQKQYIAAGFDLAVGLDGDEPAPAYIWTSVKTGDEEEYGKCSPAPTTTKSTDSIINGGSWWCFFDIRKDRITGCDQGLAHAMYPTRCTE
jgi:hypothetical protein